VKKSITPFHEWVVRQLGGEPVASPDGHEDALPRDAVDVFVCGPARMSHLLKPLSITFQGGFVPYAFHQPKKVLEKFVAQESFATFNLGGTKPAVSSALIDADVPHKWVGKNVCHTVVYTREVHDRCCPAASTSELVRLHRSFMEHYLASHDEKAFHDPLAALLHVNETLGVWQPLKPHRVKGRYTAVPAEKNHRSLVDLVEDPWATYFDALRLSRRPVAD
jgi:hypothetical protein